MNDTGTPRVPTQILFRECPEEIEIWNFIRHIVTKEDLSPVLWSQGMEKFRLYLIRVIFPKITLVAIEDQDWFKAIQPKKKGSLDPFGEQAFFSILEPAPIRMWGLTRRGKWLLGEGSMEEISLREVDCASILETYKMHPAEIATELVEFVRREMAERRRRLSELESYLSSAETFAGIAAYKPNPFKGTGIGI